MKRFNLCLGLGLFFLLATNIFAAVPQLINFQGVLRDSVGNPVVDGSHSVNFKIYDASTAGNALWTETQSVTTSAGAFNVLLGATNPVPDSTFNGINRYLGISVESNPELSPRFQLVSVGYAYRVNSVDGALGGTVSGDVIITGKATIGSFHNNTAGFTFVAGSGNTVSSTGAAVGGGMFNTASDSVATVGGGYGNTASGSLATVGGGQYNKARGAFSVVSGGGGGSSGDSNLAFGEKSAVGGGKGNIAQGFGSKVGGGSSNKATGGYSTVGGGISNIANGTYSTIGGGISNNAAESVATVSGGVGNIAGSAFATVGGGYTNAANGFYATVTGGSGNLASGFEAAVVGGSINKAMGSNSFVGGGTSNLVSGLYSTVAGGDRDIASGNWATVPGGQFNKAAGSFSFAAGRLAKALHGGAFVWADTTAADFASTGINQFLIRAGGGVGIGTNSPEVALQVDQDVEVSTFTGNNNQGLRISGTNTNDRWVLLGFDGGQGKNIAQIGSRQSGTGSFLSFGTSSAFVIGITNEAMTIDPNGMVGIGVPAPAHPLHLSSGAHVTAGGSWTNASSRSYKTDIQPLRDKEYAHILEKLENLEVVRFRYKTDPEREHIGLIAEDVPEEMASQDRKGIPTADAIAFLMAALKAQQAQIENLQETVKQLQESR